MGHEPAEGGDRARRCGAESVRPLAAMIEGWQRSGDPNQFAVLAVAVRPVVEAVALKVLRQRHIADRTAVDDVVSLVLDHLRRLPGGSGDDRHVARFRVDDSAASHGLGFIRLLARTRSLDVARSHRRRWRNTLPLSVAAEVTRHLVDGESEAAHDAEADMHDRLWAAIDRLEPRLRTVVKMLLDGDSQAAIAHELGVCEGTVSRVRGQAIARLRELLADD